MEVRGATLSDDRDRDYCIGDGVIGDAGFGVRGDALMQASLLLAHSLTCSWFGLLQAVLYLGAEGRADAVVVPSLMWSYTETVMAVALFTRFLTKKPDPAHTG
jgi:hypothetical protein